MMFRQCETMRPHACRASFHRAYDAFVRNTRRRPKAGAERVNGRPGSTSRLSGVGWPMYGWPMFQKRISAVTASTANTSLSSERTTPDVNVPFRLRSSRVSERCLIQSACR